MGGVPRWRLRAGGVGWYVSGRMAVAAEAAVAAAAAASGVGGGGFAAPAVAVVAAGWQVAVAA